MTFETSTTTDSETITETTIEETPQKGIFRHLWDNGLMRAFLGSWALVWTFVQEPVTGIAPGEQQWNIATMAATAFFVSAAMRAGKGDEG